MATTLSSAPAAHTRAELLESAANGVAGFGMAFMQYLAIIPGLLPMVALTLLAGAILAIPAVVIGVLFGLPVLLGRIVVRRVSGRTRARTAAAAPVDGPAGVAVVEAERPTYTPPATRSTAPVA